MEPPKAISGDAHEYTQPKFFSLVSSIFDPLGILAPVTILFKAILQSTWKLGSSWDSLLPANSQKELQKLLNLFVSIKPISLPRTLFKRQLTTRDNVQLHTFTDASLIGMSAVVYVRVEYQPENQLATHYVIGKSEVAPIFDSSPHPPSFANNNAFSQCQQYRCSAEYGYNNRDRRRCKFGNCSLQPTAAQYSKQHSPNSRVAKSIHCVYNSATSSPNATGTTRAA